MIPNLQKYRRDLHRIPEIGFTLPETLSYLEGVLKPMRCECFSPIEGSLCAYFDAGKPTTLAFRADMDALPVTEMTGAAYASAHPGKMHACGHDGHMSMLLGLAETLNGMQGLPNNVLLIFQPAEETTGGAKCICDTGFMEKYGAKAVFGIHIWPELPAGKIYSRPGAVMAKTGIVDLEITGKSAHVARAEEGADALYAGVAFLHEAYSMAQSMPPLGEERLLKFGCMQSGTVQNAISAHTLVSGTMRAYDEKLHARMRDALKDIANKTAEETGCKLALSISEGYPPVRNDEALYARVCAHLGKAAPEELLRPSLTGEDFSFYQQHVPGIFFFLGTGRKEALHADDFDFDEGILESGLRLYKRLVSLNI